MSERMKSNDEQTASGKDETLKAAEICPQIRAVIQRLTRVHALMIGDGYTHGAGIELNAIHDDLARIATLRASSEPTTEPAETFEAAWERLGWKDENGYEKTMAKDFFRAGFEAGRRSR